MKSIAITGSSGLIGTHLRTLLESSGYRVVPVVRSNPKPGEVKWSPREQVIDAEGLRSCHAVVHLAGEPLIGLRWTEDKKERIRESRREGTRLIAETLASLQDGPRVLVSASGIGYYGSRGDEVLTEGSSSGEGFLAEVCRLWEQSADPARAAGIRVVHTRFGPALHTDGGMLAKMLPAFKMGVGGEVGDGKQWLSWVSLNDLIRAVRFAIEHADLEGPVNVCAPEPVTNETFVQTLGDVIGRPTAIPLPKFAVKLAMGQMGEETLLVSQRAVPRELQAAGFEFEDRDLEGTLRRLLQD